MSINNVIRNSEYTENLSAMNTPSRTYEKWENGEYAILPAEPPQVTVRSERYFEIFPFGNHYVSDMLSGDRLDAFLGISYRNHRGQSVMFIDAQTGSGKTKLIFDEVYPRIKERGERLLIIVSRTTLKQQVKIDAILAACPERIDDWTQTGLAREHIFADIEVYSYQDFQSIQHSKDVKEKFDLGLYGAVIFDECHYFISDADFNQYTEMQFCTLLEMAIKKKCTANIPDRNARIRV